MIPRDTRQYSDPLQPTAAHVSYEERFDISNNKEDPAEAWHRQTSSEKVSKIPVFIPCPFRFWEIMGKRTLNRVGASLRFKVLSYNVLAQYLLECHPFLYTSCIPKNLNWQVRASRLYNEITSYEPDILCFQEVQETHLSSFYSKFEQIGYFGIFKKKTGQRYDGCAIYFKRSRFEIKNHISVEFYQPELPILNRDNIGIMVHLIPRELPSSPLVVATTHLLYNPRRTDVRLAQMQLFLAEIDRFAYFNNGRESGHLPIILTGDFNATPDSAVIKLLDRGHVSAGPYRDSSDWKRISVTDNCQHLAEYLNRKEGRRTDFSNIKIYNSEYCETAYPSSCGQHPPPSEKFSGMFNSDVISHSLKLTSVYDWRKGEDSFEATTYQGDWITVDYIYLSCCSSLKLVERLRMPTAMECVMLGHLPNRVYGSDHLALAATFELKP